MNKRVLTLIISFSLAITTVFLSASIFYIVKKAQIYDTFHKTKEIPIIAHRGYSSQYMANTCEAFLAAGESKIFDGIETDIWFTKPAQNKEEDKLTFFGEEYSFQNGIPVISHDAAPFLKDKRRINEITWKEMKYLELDQNNESVPFKNRYHHTFSWKPLEDNKLSWTEELYSREITIDGETQRGYQAYVIPTFVDYISICFWKKKLPFIEIKQNSLDFEDKTNGFEEGKIKLLSDEQLKDLVNIIKKFNIVEYSDLNISFLSYCNFISFRKKYLDSLKNYCNSLQIEQPYFQVLVSPLNSLKSCYSLIDEGYSLSLMQAMINKKIIKYSHDRGKKICGWTFDFIDNALTWSLYGSLGIDAITTDTELWLIS